jgi:hypothetical protein
MGGYGIQKKGTSPILKQAGSPGPTVPILPEDFTQGPKLPDDIAAKQKPRDTFKKGGMTKSQETIKTAMTKFKKGKLHSGNKKGPVVKSRKQAIAIALSEAGMSKKKK